MKEPIDFKNWFLKTQKLSPVVKLDFQYSLFLNPNHANSSLISKKSYYLYQSLVSIQKDVKAQLFSSTTLNRQLKESIYQNYLSDCSEKMIDPLFAESHHFWQQLNLANESKQLDSFINRYSFKVSFLFFLKQNFLCKYAHKKSVNIFEAYYANLNTFFSKLFPHGSSKHIDILGFQLNEFTWYQPNLFLSPQLKRLAVLSQESDINELLETYQLYQSFNTNKWTFNLYSSAIKTYKYFKKNKVQKPYKKHFLSHHINLAFLKDSYTKFPKTLIKIENSYTNILSELFYLINLINKDEEIDEALKLFYTTKTSLLLTDQANNQPSQVDAYFIHAPNSLKDIQKSIEDLPLQTPVYILSKKSLFSPSSREKSLNLLSSLNPIAHLNYSHLTQGQISHVYICEKVQKKQAQSSHYHLRYGGRLKRDDDFSKLEKLNFDFFKKTQDKYPMAYSAKSHDSSFYFDFFQDAIIDGLLMSASQGSNQLTHPNFFQGITNNCAPLESLFKTAPLNNDWGRDQSPLLGSTRSLPEYVLVVKSGFTQNYQTSIDIIPGTSYLGHLKEHGQVDNQYFALMPKHPDLNISLLRTFLRSTIGRQITDLCFAGNSHYRTKLKTLLIPRFIGNMERVPENVMKGLDFLRADVEELKKSSPQLLYANLKKNQLMLEELFEKYPLTILKLINRFRNRLAELVSNIDSQNNQHINFYQPQLITELQSLKTYPVLPRHEDIFIDFHVAGNQLESLMNSFKIIQHEDDIHIINLYHDQTKLVSMHTKKYLSLFLEFLLKQMNDFPLSRVLKSLNLPTEEQLAATLPSYSVDYSVINELGLKCETLVEQLLRRFIINQ